MEKKVKQLEKLLAELTETTQPLDELKQLFAIRRLSKEIHDISLDMFRKKFYSEFAIDDNYTGVLI